MRAVSCRHSSGKAGCSRPSVGFLSWLLYQGLQAAPDWRDVLFLGFISPRQSTYASSPLLTAAA